MRRKSDLPVKPCVHCGRPMVWRKKWEKTWDDVKYCSERCRREAKGRNQQPETSSFSRTFASGLSIPL